MRPPGAIVLDRLTKRYGERSRIRRPLSASIGAGQNSVITVEGGSTTLVPCLEETPETVIDG